MGKGEKKRKSEFYSVNKILGVLKGTRVVGIVYCPLLTLSMRVLTLFSKVCGCLLKLYKEFLKTFKLG